MFVSGDLALEHQTACRIWDCLKEVFPEERQVEQVQETIDHHSCQFSKNSLANNVIFNRYARFLKADQYKFI